MSTFVTKTEEFKCQIRANFPGVNGTPVPPRGELGAKYYQMQGASTSGLQTDTFLVAGVGWGGGVGGSKSLRKRNLHCGSKESDIQSTQEAASAGVSVGG